MSEEQSMPSVDSDLDLDRVLDLLLQHKSTIVQDYLREKGLHFSGTKRTLRRRLTEYVGNSRLEVNDLIMLLDQIEGWGDQHVYLYHVQLDNRWSDQNSVNLMLVSIGWGELINSPRPLLLPEEPSLSGITLSSEHLRLVWVEKRVIKTRTPEEDLSEGDMLWQAYRVGLARGVISFDLDILTGEAMLMIQTLPAGRVYAHIRDQYAEKLRPLLPIEESHRVRVGGAIQALNASDEVRIRRSNYRTRAGGHARLSSSRAGQDALKDRQLGDAYRALGQDKAPELGDYYWVVDHDHLKSELHMRIHPEDEHIAILGEKTEAEVRHVLSRIRRYCR